MADSYTKPYTIDAGAGGDTVKAAVATKTDGNVDYIITSLNAHAGLITNAHSLKSAAQVTTGAFEAAGAISTHAALTTGAHSLLSAALVSTGYFDLSGAATSALSSAAALVSTHAALSTSAHSLGDAAFVSSAYFVQTTRAKFLALWTSTVENVTGDGTAFALTGAYWTEVFDTSSNFSAGTFTAPATGQYLLGCTIQLGGCTDATALYLYINTGNRNHIVLYCQPTNIATSGTLVYNASVITDMDINDTATLSLTASGGTKIIDVVGGGTGTTFFFGQQI